MSDMVERVAKLDKLIETVFKAGHSDGWRGNQLRRKVQHEDAQDGWDALVRNDARIVRDLRAALGEQP